MRKMRDILLIFSVIVIFSIMITDNAIADSSMDIPVERGEQPITPSVAVSPVKYPYTIVDTSQTACYNASVKIIAPKPGEAF